MVFEKVITKVFVMIRNNHYKTNEIVNRSILNTQIVIKRNKPPFISRPALALQILQINSIYKTKYKNNSPLKVFTFRLKIPFFNKKHTRNELK